MATRPNTTSQPQHPQMTRKVKTRVSKDADAIESNVTVIFDDPTTTMEFAMRGAVIAWQAICRDAGVIPASETVSVSDLKKRSAERGFAKPTAASTHARIMKLSIDEYRATLVALKLAPKEVERLVAIRQREMTSA